jgi:glycosyltransferase involved in cell wall biosynthesis
MTAAQPAVSVIVPCYKVTEHVPEALDSLRAQTFRDFEVIVINDGCPDTENLEHALEPYRGEIVYIKQENAGLGGARNRGIRAARAPLIALLDPDDAWEPNYLEVQTGILRAHPEIDVLYPNAVYFGDGAGSWSGRKLMDMLPSDGEPTFQRILSKRCTVFIGVTARREALLRVGLFDCDPGLHGAEDLLLWLRLAKAGAKFSYHRLPLARYRIREGSLSDDRVAIGRAALCAYRKLLGADGVTEEEEREIQNAIRMQEVAIEFYLGRKALYAGNRDEALRRLTRASEALRNYRLRAAIVMLRIWPGPLYKYIHRRYPTEYSFLH